MSEANHPHTSQSTAMNSILCSGAPQTCAILKPWTRCPPSVWDLTYLEVSHDTIWLKTTFVGLWLADGVLIILVRLHYPTLLLHFVYHAGKVYRMTSPHCLFPLRSSILSLFVPTGALVGSCVRGSPPPSRKSIGPDASGRSPYSAGCTILLDVISRIPTLVCA